MKKNIFIAVSLFLLGFLLGVKPLQGKKLISLPEVAHPFSFIVDKDQMFVSDGLPTLHYYSLKELKYVKPLAQKGIGPKEVDITQLLTIHPDYLFVYLNNRKAMYFSRKGDFIREFRVFNFRDLAPVGSNFVGRRAVRAQNNGSAYEYSIYTYDHKDFIYKKLIYYYEFPRPGRSGGKEDYPVVHDDVFYTVYDDKVFIADTSRGLFVDIFDQNGTQFERVKLLQFDKIKVSDQFKNDFMETVKKQAEFEIIQSMNNIVFPEYFPAFYRFAVGKNKIYFLTYRKKDNKREVIISDWKGKLLKKTWVPWIESGPFFNFSIWNNKFYYITENEDTEEWELHVEEIK